MAGKPRWRSACQFRQKTSWARSIWSPSNVAANMTEKKMSFAKSRGCSAPSVAPTREPQTSAAPAITPAVPETRPGDLCQPATESSSAQPATGPTLSRIPTTPSVTGMPFSAATRATDVAAADVARADVAPADVAAADVAAVDVAPADVAAASFSPRHVDYRVPLATHCDVDISTVDAEKLTTSYRTTQRNMLVGCAIVLLGAAAYPAFSFMHITAASRLCAFFLLALPVSLVMLLKQISSRLAPANPPLATKLCNWLTLGSPVAKCHVASLEFDTGDFIQGEKTLSVAAKAVQPKHLAQYIFTHGSLAFARAKVGQTVQARELISQTLETATAWKNSHPTTSAIISAATTYQLAADIQYLEDHEEQALSLYLKALEQAVGLKAPPVELLVSLLWRTGHLLGLLGHFDNAVPYLQKARQLADGMPDLSVSLRAAIYGDLAFIAKDNACEAEFDQLTRLPSSKSHLPAVYRLRARAAAARDDVARASAEYKLAIDASTAQRPSTSFEFASIASEYSGFLQTLNRDGEAAALALKATQAKYSLQQSNFMVEEQGKKVSIKPQAKQMAVNRGRFPIFCLLLTIWYGFCVWLEGFRVADYHAWAWFFGFATVTALKLRAKYGTQIAEDAPGALIMVLSHVPFARYIVPELSRLSQKTVAVFAAAGLAFALMAKAVNVPPNTVPPSGLSSYEYMRRGMDFLRQDEFLKAQACFAQVSGTDANSKEMAQQKRDCMPVRMPPPEAVEMNAKALRLQHSKDRAEAKALWEHSISKYPDFEMPYVHLENLLRLESLRTKDKAALARREQLLTKALAINPKNQMCVASMVNVKLDQDDKEGAQKYIAQLDDLSRQLFSALLDAKQRSKQAKK